VQFVLATEIAKMLDHKEYDITITGMLSELPIHDRTNEPSNSNASPPLKKASKK